MQSIANNFLATTMNELSELQILANWAEYFLKEKFQETPDNFNLAITKNFFRSLLSPEKSS